MFDYSAQIESFRCEKVRLASELKSRLYDRRNANRNRLICRLPERIIGLTISGNDFKPQGSMAVDTIVQTKFRFEEYDIDDGLVLRRDDLVDENGEELTADQVRGHVLKALKDSRFAKQPKLVSNAVRVFYKEEDTDRHHIDFPVYRKFINADGNWVRELAGESGWIESDPTQVNVWFKGEVEGRNQSVSGHGTQFRRLIQLLKRFCRSRNNWDMPNGMKLTMLVAECQPAFSERIDVAFRALFENMEERLEADKVIRNLAHPDKPELTRTASDSNVEDLLAKISEAIDQLSELDESVDDKKTTRRVWEWIFQADSFFRDYDDDQEEKDRREEEKCGRLMEKAHLINSGIARTSGLGVIGITGIANAAHRFHGESF